MAADPRLISKFMGQMKNADPRAWEGFMRSFDEYVTELTVAVTEAPPSDILVSQGRAQIARKLFQMFLEIPPGT